MKKLTEPGVVAVREEWRPLVERCVEQGNAKGLPSPPAGLPEGGGYKLQWRRRADGMRLYRLYYVAVKGGEMVGLGGYLAPDGEREACGELSRADLPQPGKNGTGPKPAPVLTPGAGVLEPVIMLRPTGGGGWQVDAVGIEPRELVQVLRLVLVDVVGRLAGVRVFESHVSPGLAVAYPVRAERVTLAAARRNDGYHADPVDLYVSSASDDDDMVVVGLPRRKQ